MLYTILTLGMKQINRKAVPFLLRPFAPDFWAENVAEIDFAKLAKEYNIDAVAFDIDSTLVEYRKPKISEKTLSNIRNARKSKYIKKIAIATNRRGYDFPEIVEQVGEPVVINHARSFFDSKPWSAYYTRLLKKLDSPAKNTLMVGDKMFTDIVGANRARLRTLHVDRLGQDSWFDKVLPFRYIERYIANHYKKRNI